MTHPDSSRPSFIQQPERGFLNAAPQLTINHRHPWESDDDSDEPKPSTWLISAGVGESERAAPSEERTPTEVLPGPCITGTATRQSSPLEAWECSGGVDKLVVTIFGFFGPDAEAIAGQLEQARQNVAQKKGSGFVNVFGASLILGPQGHRWANTFMPWVGEYDGIKYSIARWNQSDKCPVAKVEIGSLKLMRDGHRYAWEQALRTLEQLGIRVVEGSVTRIDVCIDQAGVPVAPYCEAIFNEQVISRIRSKAGFNKNEDGSWQGCSVGTSDGVRVSIYDKVRELHDKGGDQEEPKREVLIQRRWGYDADVATRVEFQMSGKWLRSRWKNVKTVEEVFDRLDSIMDYLVNGFFRLVDGEVDRENRNQSRDCPMSPLWQRVVDGFVEALEQNKKVLEKIDPKLPNMKKRVQRLVSAALSICKLTPDYFEEEHQVLERTLNVLASALHDTDWRAVLIQEWDRRLATGTHHVICIDAESFERGRFKPLYDIEVVPRFDEPRADYKPRDMAKPLGLK